MQTLQVYRKVEKIPSVVQIKKLINELDSMKKSYTLSAPVREKKDPEKIEPEDPFEGPKIKSIDLQNTLTRLEKKLAFWVNEYRSFIDELRELDRILPKTEHELEESDAKAQENVDKIIRVEEIKELVLSEFTNVCLLYEESEEKSKRRIRRLQTELAGTQAKVENLEYDLKRLRNKH